MRETEWAKKFEESIKSAGGACYQNATTANNNGLPDKTIKTLDNQTVYVELKSETAPLRLNQYQKLRAINLRSLLTTGAIAGFVYRYPDSLRVPLGYHTALEIAVVDAVANPLGFLRYVANYSLIDQVTKEPNELFQRLVKEYCPNLELRQYRVTMTEEGPMSYASSVCVKSYLARLAAYQATGLRLESVPRGVRVEVFGDPSGESVAISLPTPEYRCTPIAERAN